MSSLKKHREEPIWWHSLDELAGTPRFREFLESEFPSEADPGGINRRRWLQMMGASLALAAANGCRWEKQDILPFAKRPEGYTPGKTKRFATAMPLGDAAVGLEVTTVDGRPIKIEGNPRHPCSLGATDALAQAALLELYDPDRSRVVTLRAGEKTEEKTWRQFGEICQASLDRLREPGGAGFRVLSEASSSPTLADLRSRLLKALPQARWFDFEPLGDDNARDFAAGRTPEAGRMNRLYVVESSVTLTGAAADHRLSLQSSAIPAFVAMLERELAATAGTPKHPDQSNPAQQFAQATAGDLLDPRNRGRGVVCIGPGQPPAAHAAMRSLTDEMRAGKVDTLLILGGNPVYNAPADLAFGDVLERVETTIHLSAYRDETSRRCTWHLPRAHFLESWGDGRGHDGTYSVIQPMIEPLGNGRSAIEVLAWILSSISETGTRPTELEKLVQRTFREQIAGDSIAGNSAVSWRQVLRDGLAAESRWPVEPVSAPGKDAKDTAKEEAVSEDALPRDEKPDAGRLEVVFRRDASVYDGRFANNSWLQELPDPITKMTWGNAALVSPATAEKLGLRNETLAKLKVGGRSASIPVYVLPGQAAGTITLPLGYG